MQIIRIRDLQLENVFDPNLYVPVDHDSYFSNAKKLKFSDLSNWITGTTFAWLSGKTSGDTIENFWFNEQTGALTLETDKGYWITNIYFTGSTQIQNNDVLIYSATTSNTGFWYPTGATWDTIKNFQFNEQNGELILETAKGFWITNIYQTGTTQIQTGDILVYSATTSTSDFGIQLV